MKRTVPSLKVMLASGTTFPAMMICTRGAASQSVAVSRSDFCMAVKVGLPAGLPSSSKTQARFPRISAYFRLIPGISAFPTRWACAGQPQPWRRRMHLGDFTFPPLLAPKNQGGSRWIKLNQGESRHFETFFYAKIKKRDSCLGPLVFRSGPRINLPSISTHPTLGKSG